MDEGTRGLCKKVRYNTITLVFFKYYEHLEPLIRHGNTLVMNI